MIHCKKLVVAGLKVALRWIVILMILRPNQVRAHLSPFIRFNLAIIDRCRIGGKFA